uniref:RxLR effector protein n=1 Tax=Proboscia inermis TaxID=420281 RepID=A0A7S0GJF4_9STRA|mmetsp:Transcript_43244/g.43832  ORF Transcript_43244/g.43832 Transcript_43244/m.43832 type:complete len:116 (+) Transcript_43244:3-350(+)
MTLLLLLLIGLLNLSSATISDMNDEINLRREKSTVKKNLRGHSNGSRSTSSIGRTSTEPSSESPEMRRVIVTLSDATSFQNRSTERNNKQLFFFWDCLALRRRQSSLFAWCHQDS